ncbi:hypothetical protein DN748_16605 [Sinomicrobium soli]|nr:hypothetical protein DN748_16605 [Sinomicrobium sp. N-1-3-6]
MKGTARLLLVSVLTVTLAFSSCNTGNSGKKFAWDPGIAELTGKNLGQWLRKSPFSNELQQTDADKIVFTNAEEVFPFMGRYNNAVEALNYAYDGTGTIYREETVLYQDPEWGDLFVNAVLLFEDGEVFLKDHYSATGSPVFGGVDAVMRTNSSSLRETGIYGTYDGNRKNAVYWALTGGTRYLLGFCQKGQLVFEVAIPADKGDTLAVLDKLKEVNRALGLDITDWETAITADLETRDTRETFWKDPFQGIYFTSESMRDEVRLKLKDTPLKPSERPFDGDYSFEYPSPGGKVVLYTLKKETGKDETSFKEELQELPSYTNGLNHIFYEEEEQVQDRVRGVAKTYCRNNTYLEIHYEYPASDEEARTVIHGVLKYVKVSKF